jgi:glucose-6-phosphate-specific signal transduction histidine kinase
MTKRRYHQYRLLRKLALFMAAVPLFQLAQCSTGIRQTSATMANTLFAMVEGLILLPFQWVFGLGTI